MDFGCGIGCYTIGLAELAEAAGRVIAIDLQQKMLGIIWSGVQRGKDWPQQKTAFSSCRIV